MANVKTVVELDLEGFGKRARDLEENLDAKAVAQFEQQIEGFVDEALSVVGGSRNEHVKHTAGDATILMFDSSETANDFAVSLHLAAQKHNAVRTQTTAHRLFRVGISRGVVEEACSTGGVYRFSGIVVTNAKRLEQAARPGEILIDVTVYSDLPAAAKLLFGKEEVVAGKSDETFRAHRRKVVPYTGPIELNAGAEPRAVRRKPRLFVGSSTHDCLNFELLKKLLRKEAELSIWKGDIFEDAPDKLLRVREEVARNDFAVFIFAPEDMAGSGVSLLRAQHISYKLGNFAGKLGEDRMFALIPKGSDRSQLPHFLPTNIVGCRHGERIHNEDLRGACWTIGRTIAGKGIWCPPAPIPFEVKVMALRPGDEVEQTQVVRPWVHNLDMTAPREKVEIEPLGYVAEDDADY